VSIVLDIIEHQIST